MSTRAQRRAARFARIDKKFGRPNPYNTYDGDLDAYLADLDERNEAIEAEWAADIGWFRTPEYFAAVYGYTILEDDYSEESFA